VKAKIDNVKAKIQDEEDQGPRSRPTLARRQVSDQLAASPTSSLQEGSPREVSASHEKSPPRTTYPDSDWCVGHDTQRELRTRVPPPTRIGERFPVPCKYTSWRPCKQLAPTRALMLACLVARPSHRHHLPLSTCKPSSRHSSTLYDALEPRLRPKRGGLVKYSGRLRQQKTTQRRCQASRGEQPCPATRRLPQPSSATPHQCILMNNDTRRDIPTTKHCASFLLPLVPLPL
jgi:hypothetical protein